MKKTLLAAIAFALVFNFFCLLSCNTQPGRATQNEHITNDSALDKKNFVTLADNEFRINGKRFYPMAVNYIVSLQANKNEVWPAVNKAYNPQSRYPSFSKDSALMQLQAELDLAKEIGFNTIRVVGCGEPSIDTLNGNTISYFAHVSNEKDTSINLQTNDDYIKYFNALQLLFDAANKAELKVIFLDRVWAETPWADVFLLRLAARFKNETAIMAYDLFNEPLYFDKPQWTKKQIYDISIRWNTIFKQYAPKQLTTIGLEGIREVHEWDPNILAFDFLTFHPYEYEPEQVRNEIYWYGKYVKKPWMLGETAIPADDDSVKYSTQKEFAEKTILQTYNSGGLGYAWWQFKDVDWKVYHATYMGVLNWHNTTIGNKNKFPVYGTVKPIADAIKNFDTNQAKQQPVFLPNYYNYTSNNAFVLKGKLVDENNKPIVGGVILAWNEWWTHSYHTITKEDGSFELTSHYPFYHWIASACGYSMVRNEIDPKTAKLINGIPQIDLGVLEIEKLPFGVNAK
jgi:hypothetical protein